MSDFDITAEEAADCKILLLNPEPNDLTGKSRISTAKENK